MELQGQRQTVLVDEAAARVAGPAAADGPAASAPSGARRGTVPRGVPRASARPARTSP